MPTPFYNEGDFYGTTFYGPSDVDTPINLAFYRTSQQNVYTFWWGFSAAFISPALFTFEYELQIDTVPTFNSPNLVTFTSGLANDSTQSIPFHITDVVDATHLIIDSTSGMINGDTIVQGANSTTITTVTDSTHLVVGSTAGWVATNVITYQNGNVVKGYTIPVAARIDNVVQTWYARVSIISGLEQSPWSAILVWTIPAKQQQQFAENLMNSLPDYHVYGKGDLLKPPNQRNSNLYLVENMYGNQLDTASYTNFLTQSSNSIELCLDEDLYQNFGVLFNFTKPTSMQYVDYRYILMNLIAASLVGSTNEAVILSIQGFTGVAPTIIPIRNENDFFLSTIQDPPIVPSGPQSVFHTSEPFISTTLVVEDITTGLLVSNSSYTTDSAQGTWTMNTPTTDTLQATFDVGNVLDPIVTIFDSTDNTLLSGTVLFTNNSTGIIGFGTSFTTQLTPYLPNAEITDTGLIYLGLVASVIDDTHAVLSQPWTGPTENVSAFRLTYTDVQLPVPICWEAETLAFGVQIIINNPGEFVLF